MSLALLRFGAFVIGALTSGACRSSAERPVGSGASPAVTASTLPVEKAPEPVDAGLESAPDAGAAELAPLAADAPFVPLEVEGYRPAIVSVPAGARRARPVLVALHGNFDRPEWQCEVWRGITSFPFILCPRGIPRGDAPKSLDRWTYGGLKATEAELMAGLEALKKRFGAYIDDGPLLYTGFSLGAIYGARMLRDHPEQFPRAVLTEGGYESWARPAAKK